MFRKREQATQITATQPGGRGGPSQQNRRAAAAFWIALVAVACTIGAWGIVHHPAYQEWRLAQMSSAALQQERAGRTDDPRLLYYIGLRLNEQGKFQEALPLLQQGVGLEFDSPRLRDELARAQLGLGRFSEAFGQLRQFAGAHPDSAPAHLLLGKFYLTLRSLQRAREELEQAVRLDASSGEAWSYLATTWNSLGNMQKALEAAQKAVALRPENAQDNLAVAIQLTHANRNLEARSAYERAVALGPNEANIQMEAARWLLTHAQGPEGHQKAETAARRAVRAAPATAAAQLILGRVLIWNGRLEAACEPLQQAADLALNDPAPALVLTQVYHRLGRQKEELLWRRRYLERQAFADRRQNLLDALTAHPNARETHRQLARLLGRHGDDSGAVRNYAAALGCPPDAPAALTAAAGDLIEGGYADQALSLTRRAVASAPSDWSVQERYGDALLATGAMEQASAIYARVRLAKPQRTAALKAKLERYSALPAQGRGTSIPPRYPQSR